MASRSKWAPGIGPAFLAALRFGVSTPLAKLVMGDIHPALFAGLLYAGSGLGLGVFWILQQLRRRQRQSQLREWK